MRFWVRFEPSFFVLHFLGIFFFSLFFHFFCDTSVPVLGRTLQLDTPPPALLSAVGRQLLQRRCLKEAMQVARALVASPMPLADDAWIFMSEVNFAAGQCDLAIAALSNCSGPSDWDLTANAPPPDAEFAERVPGSVSMCVFI
jgi:hypothetical protein